MLCCGNLENYFNKWIKGLNRLLGKIRLCFKPEVYKSPIPSIHLSLADQVFCRQLLVIPFAICIHPSFLC